MGASPEKVYEALVTSEGLRGWWTADSTADAQIGGVAEFGFDSRGTVFRMRIEERRPAARVVWACVGGPQEWQGTRLTWSSPPRRGGTALRFTHADWRAPTPRFASCNSMWGALMFRLKDYVEGKRPGPRWTT
ncbi:MAG TPA: SRPBCC domain-containing protein [bacterium]|nr:SRPBCC domain-containing protein [bacterium]